MVMLDRDFEHDLEVVERELENERRMEDYCDAEKARRKRLYSYLVSYTKGRPLRIVRAVRSPSFQRLKKGRRWKDYLPWKSSWRTMSR
jgi:hypothetical protein